MCDDFVMDVMMCRRDIMRITFYDNFLTCKELFNEKWRPVYYNMTFGSFVNGSSMTLDLVFVER